jgi:hypothetical protein
MIVRDGAAFRIHQQADERSCRCGRVPAHVVARLTFADGLVPFRGDPDRLVQPSLPALPKLKPLPVQPDPGVWHRPPRSVLNQLVDQDSQGVRLRAAAGRFLADYHLAASPGRLRTDAPAALAAARARLEQVEAALGSVRVDMIEMLVLDKFSAVALRHVTGAEPSVALQALTRLAVAHGLAKPDQVAGRAFASA